MALEVYPRGRFFWLRGTIETVDGEQRVHESTGQTDRGKANQVRITKEKQALDDLLIGPKATYTFAQAVQLYLDAGKDGRFLLPLLDHFKDTRISKMTGDDVRAAAKVLYPTAAYTTWNRQVITPAKAAINHAANAGKCHEVKIKGFAKKDPDSRRSTRPARRAVARSYIDAFRAHCRNPRLGAMMLFMHVTAARLGDAIGLEPANLDLANRTALLVDTKTGEDRVADLTIELVYVLQQIEPKKGRVFGYTSRHGYLYREIKATCARAGIPYLATHQPGRHSFGTEMMVRNKVDVDTTAKKGGWKSKRLLVEVYVHGDDGKGVIDKVFGKKRKPAKAA
jgi:integrase